MKTRCPRNTIIEPCLHQAWNIPFFVPQWNPAGSFNMIPQFRKHGSTTIPPIAVVPKIKDLTNTTGAQRFWSSNICRLRWLHNHYHPKSETLFLQRLDRRKWAQKLHPTGASVSPQIVVDLCLHFSAELLLLRNQLAKPLWCLLGAGNVVRKTDALWAHSFHLGHRWSCAIIYRQEFGAIRIQQIHNTRYAGTQARGL